MSAEPAAIRVAVDASSPVPPFEQVRAGLEEAIRSGELPAGTRLPTVRRLAEQLDLAVNTVARAYRELEQEGRIDTRGRSGTFVAGAGVDAALRARIEARLSA